MKVYCFCMFICFVIFSCQSKHSNLQDKLGDTLAIYRESIPKQLNEPFKIEKPKGSNDVNYRFFIYRTFSDYYFCVNIIATNLFANDQKIVLKFKDTNSLGHEVTVPENQGAEIFYKMMDTLHYEEFFSRPVNIEDSDLMVSFITDGDVVFFERANCKEYRYIIRSSGNGKLYEFMYKLMDDVKLKK